MQHCRASQTSDIPVTLAVLVHLVGTDQGTFSLGLLVAHMEYVLAYRARLVVPEGLAFPFDPEDLSHLVVLYNWNKFANILP